MLNTIVAESLDYIATQLEVATKAGKSLNKAIQELLPGVLKESKKVIFNGDNYSEEWHREAEKRGLPNLRNTVDALPVILRKDTLELFTKYRVYSERELQSRYNILCESYVKKGNEQYVNLLEFSSQYDLPLTISASLLGGEAPGSGGGEVQTLLRLGQFEISCAT